MPAFFSKMVGPLPMGAWAGVVAAGAGLGVVARKKKEAATPAAAAPVLMAPPSPLGGLYSSLTPGLLPAALPGPLQTTIETNQQWQREATRRLIGVGYTGYAAEQAISKYFAALDALTPEEHATIETAIRLLGPPPDPPSLAPPALKATPPPAPAAPVFVTNPVPGNVPGPGPGTMDPGQLAWALNARRTWNRPDGSGMTAALAAEWNALPETIKFYAVTHA